MEALIYEESPLADVLEGDAVPFEIPQSAPSTPHHYAPRGLPRIQAHLQDLRHKTTWLSDSSEQRFLERFRYTIVGSQLLSEESGPRSHAPDEDGSTAIAFTLRGAITIAVLPFLFVWLFSWLSTRSISAASQSEIGLYCFVAGALVFAAALTARRQYLRFVRYTALSAAADLIRISQDFDRTTGSALRYIQEIEVVARGYELSSFLPPISKLDDKHVTRQCRELRALTAKHLTDGISQFVHFHNQLHAYVNQDDLHTYYHIYELSADSFAETVSFANDLSTEAQESLRQLRFLLELHNVARKFFLVDLLALRVRSSWSSLHTWRKIGHILTTVSADKAQATQNLQDTLHREDEPISQTRLAIDGNNVSSPIDASPGPPSKQQSKAQMRRFDSLVHSIRSLNAKAKIARDEVTSAIATDSGEPIVSASLARHYDSLGNELRTLLSEWDRGRSAMLLDIDSDARASRPSSGLRSSPMSPSPSLGGLTMVDGGPADALKVLNGDDEPNGAAVPSGIDEEVFEAVAKPRKRMSLALSRDEKIAKLQEDRRKRATLQEQADTTTNMLRELQMVIKHRPTASRSINRITSV